MAVEDFTPTVEEVGAYLRARTKDRFGNEDGTFNADTRPTGEQVDGLIVDAVQEVSTHVGDLDGDQECVPRLRERAKGAVILYTAMLVELSYSPEQVGSGRSPFDNFEKLYEKRIKTLTEAVAECIGGGDGESVGGGSGAMPSSSFPCPSGWGEVSW